MQTYENYFLVTKLINAFLESLHVPEELIMRSRAKKIEEAMQGLVQAMWSNGPFLN